MIRDTSRPLVIRAHEASVWLRQRAGDVLAAARPELEQVGPVDVVLVPLGRHGESGSRLDRSCDRCGVYCPPHTEFWLITWQPDAGLIFTGGLCRACQRREVPA